MVPGHRLGAAERDGVDLYHRMPDLPTIQVVFLYGRENPVIEQAEADFSVLGIQMRDFHDLGVKKQDPRGGIKMMGK